MPMDSKTKKIKTVDLKRQLPPWAKVVKTVNETDIYNMNILDNIMSWNQDNLDLPALDYYGYTISYRDLPDKVNEYACGFSAIGIQPGDIVTLCLPVSIENILSLFALDYMGAVSNNVNYLFLKNDFDLYTQQKGSDTLITADVYLPYFVDYLESSQIKKVIVMSLRDYLPDNNLHVFDDMSKLPSKLKKIFNNPKKWVECANKVKKIARKKEIMFLTVPQIVDIGRKNLVPMKHEPVDIERDVSYSYTSGTTGRPKCIVYKEASANAYIEMHIGVDTKDYVGERVFQVIPLTHATGERACLYQSMSRAKTIVPQPIYNKETFGEDVMKSKCNWIVAAASFYLAGVENGVVSPNAFKHVTRPSSGGEPVTKSNVKVINDWLKANGCNTRFSISGGAAEDGSGTVFSYFMDEETHTNETGHPLEPHIKVRILDEDGNPVKKGERGFFEASSPAAADRYLNNEEATAKRWYVDEDGIRWGKTGDIAVQNPDDSYNILGRADDSYVDKNGNRIFLFDIEYSLEEDEPVIEWEITAHKTDDGYAVVGQIVPMKGTKYSNADLVEHLCAKYHLDAVKIYDRFENSDVTGKRDFKLLKADRTGYLAPHDDKYLKRIDYPVGKEPQVVLIERNKA